MSSVISDHHFHDERAAYAYVEARIWPNGPVCPHCGNADHARIIKMAGKSTRIGVHNCRECRKPFTVKVGTVFESSHVPLRLWLQAIHLLCSSKKGISSNQLHRILGVTLKTAWFMSHRIREAMRDGGLSPLGGAGQIVEIDETVIGRTDGAPKKIVGGRSGFRNVAFSLVARSGPARTFHVDGAAMADLLPVIRANVHPKSTVMTDEHASYQHLGKEFGRHASVNHSKDEYVRYTNAAIFPSGKPYVIHTNTVEGYFSVFKRGMKGIYQHCSEKHLHRYLAEFDFRYSNRAKLGIDDIVRADLALRGAAGKRLTYRTACD
ncbi:MAG: IS1595 family transposase [Beijerinckiaceae bacterium]|nr:IS1595 family transposase [Beijerinckiaceae bacterium]